MPAHKLLVFDTSTGSVQRLAEDGACSRVDAHEFISVPKGPTCVSCALALYPCNISCSAGRANLLWRRMWEER